MNLRKRIKTPQVSQYRDHKRLSEWAHHEKPRRNAHEDSTRPSPGWVLRRLYLWTRTSRDRKDWTPKSWGRRVP